MKNLFTFSFFLLFSAIIPVSATTFTVDNNAGSTAQYTNLQTAIDAAQPGDTLLVAGSATSYGNVTVRKKLILIGAGYAGLQSSISNLTFLNLTAASGSSDSFVSGFSINGIRFGTSYTGQTGRASLSGLIVERSNLTTINFDNTQDDYSNFIFRNNILNGTTNFNSNNSLEATYSNMLFSNNIHNAGVFFSGVNVSISNGQEFISSLQNVSGVAIRNGIFIGSSSAAFSDMRGATVENNIFYSRNLISEADYASFDSLQYSLNFNNNITYLTSQDLTLNSWYAVGADNQMADPLFESFPVDGAAFSVDHNYRLKAGSPGVGAGVNGEDLGIYGGTYPWPGDLALYPKGPRMTELKPVGSPSVPAGSTLEVQFKSVINN
ncbi:MAG: hypothetical protein AB8B73_10885 [Ekhidna sp.]